jgi:excinuclease UvrABC ATPase subunit
MTTGGIRVQTRCPVRGARHSFLEGLSTYSRRRLLQAQRPDVDRIDHLPPALALRQRPPIPGPRSTVGTMSEVLTVLRLMTSRLGSHLWARKPCFSVRFALFVHA